MWSTRKPSPITDSLGQLSDRPVSKFSTPEENQDEYFEQINSIEKQFVTKWQKYINYSTISKFAAAFEIVEDDSYIKLCNENRFEFLLPLFVNLGYNICLIPFRIVEVQIGDKIRFDMRTNFMQNSICTIQVLTASIVCFLVAYAQVGNIEKNPLVIFNVWSYFVFTGWCVLFANLFWKKQDIILNILNNPTDLKLAGSRVDFPNRRDNSLEKTMATIYFYGVILEEIFHKSFFYLFPKVYGLQSAAEVYSGKAMYSLFVTNNSKPIPYEKISPVMLGVSIWHFVGWQIFGAIKSHFYIFVAFSSLFLIGRINQGISAIRIKRESMDENRVWSAFAQVRSSVQGINTLTNLCVLGIYMILVPFLSARFIRRWDVDKIEYKILMVLQFVWPMVGLAAASEASRMGGKFLKMVKHESDRIALVQSSRSAEMQQCAAYYVYEDANLSMKGGKFFNVSYSFMGTTFSVVLTYGLVVLGFLHTTTFTTQTC